ncbi:MAG: nucleotidyltransferase [Polyangiaceae bacterium]
MDLPDDFRDLLVCLHDAGAEIAIVGGYAVAFHGHVRATKDLDVLIRPTAENARKVYRGLAAFGAPLAAFEVSDADFATYDGVLQIGVAPVRVDILNRIAVPFDEVIADGDRLDVEGRSIAVIGRDALIRAKRAAGRPQDIADVAALERSDDVEPAQG